MLRDMDVLFTPITLRALTLRNRFVMPGMQCGLMSDGAPTRRLVDYMRRCAAGGVGLIISESAAPDHPSAHGNPHMGRIHESTLAAWKRVIDVVHDGGAGFLAQLWHPGALRTVPAEHALRDSPAFSPSGVARSGHASSRAMTRDDLDELKRAYVLAAEQMKDIGADGVELHAGHGYLLDQFLWAETNRREDEYGGASLAHRARYPAEIVRAIRAAVGEDFVIACRFSQFKQADYDATIASGPDELRGLTAVLREASVDMFDVSSRRFHKPEWPCSEHPDYTVAEWTRSMTDAPVMTCGGVGSGPAVEGDLGFLAARVRQGTLDLVGVGRAHLANNDFVRIVRERRYADVTLFDKNTHLALP